MPVSAYYLDTEGRLKTDLNEEEIGRAWESGQGLLWVDAADPDEEVSHFLKRVFNFHHLAIEDCVSANLHPPKIDMFADYLFIVVHGVNYSVNSDIVETTELDAFLGAHFVVTSHRVPLYSVESVRHRVEDDGRPMRRGADFLLHAIVDALVDNVLPTIDNMAERADVIEEEVLRNPQQSTLEAILQLKRSTLRLHRVMTPQRDILNRLSRGEFPIVRQDTQIFYRDIYDHLVRIEELTQSIRDRADNALATHLSSVANRQNETMRVLSIVAAVFLPLSLIAGIYGMNFQNMPELQVPWAYFAVLAFMGLVALNAIWWLWGRRWVDLRRWKASRKQLLRVDMRKLVGHVGHSSHLRRRKS